MDPFNERVVSKDGDHNVQDDVERVLVPGPPVEVSRAGESDSDSTFGSCSKSQHMFMNICNSTMRVSACIMHGLDRLKEY